MSVRFEYRLSPNARHAVCLAGTGEPGLRLQT
ncbi:MAG: hypothetical protein QOG75_2479, partial [Mycobacterium sp.]|nr:hypothetical protein [Mycobacterium sp.]